MTNRPVSNDAVASIRAAESVSKTLLERVRGQDEAAWRRLAAFCGPLVYAWCRRFGIQPDDAADLLQEVLLTVHSKLGTFRRDRPGDTFRGWLWMVTRNKIQDYFRAHAARPHAAGGTDAQQRFLELPEKEPPTGETTASGPKPSNPILKGVETLRGEFEGRTWRAFWRVTVDGQPAADVAAELEMSVNAVRKAKCRVLRRLREEFDGMID